MVDATNQIGGICVNACMMSISSALPLNAMPSVQRPLAAENLNSLKHIIMHWLQRI